ncbi:FAD-linked oxidase domain protein, partial [Haloferax sp. BAB-2207]
MATQERPDDPRGDRRADTRGDQRADPSDDPRAGYDYVGGDTDREALVSDLDRLVDGDVRFDEYTR